MAVATAVAVHAPPGDFLLRHWPLAHSRELTRVEEDATAVGALVDTYRRCYRVGPGLELHAAPRAVENTVVIDVTRLRLESAFQGRPHPLALPVDEL